MSIKLKKHNEEVYKKIQEGFEHSKKVAVIHPTGTGKSFLALKLLEDNKDKEAIYIAPSNAILHNIKKNILESEMDMTDFPNLERMTYQKLMELSDEEIEKLGADIVILDEFHHCGAPEWGAGIDRLLGNNPDAQVLGLSATPIRYFDNSRDMAKELFGDNIASEMTLEEAINSGILPRAKYVSALYEIDEELGKIQDDIEKIRDPEKKKQAQAMFEKLAKQVDENIENLPTMLAEHMKAKNGKYIVFCKNIEDMQEKIEQAQSMFGEVNPNIRTYTVSSKLVNNNRTLRRFEKDNDKDTLKLMFAVDMLNEGYHINDLDGVVMMRPTYSPTIYAQQLGRALTVKDENGKQPLVIDLVNNFDSIKIIEDLYERLRQYEPTGEHKKNQEQQGGLIIHDKTKEFIDIARKISELSKRKMISLQEKIETFERYLEEENGDIDGLTVFEGKPIGKWAIQIRSMLKSENKLINPTNEQLERLEELGILERRIDSTIDEKIDALIEWRQNHPNIKVERKYKGKSITEETIEDLKELARAEGVEFSEIEDRYKKIQSYNEYVISRDVRGKLTDEQKLKCKNGNLGGRFGFSTEIEELADKLKIDARRVYSLTSFFGSVDKFVQMYRYGGKFTENIVYWKRHLINNMIDMDYNPLAANYSKLVDACFHTTILYEREFLLFSSDGVEKAVETLNPREKELIKLRFGLTDGECKSLDDVIKHFNVTKERLRQIEEKSLRKLKHSSRVNLYKLIKIKDLKENEYVTDEEKEALTDLENDIWNSNLVFKHDSIDDLDFNKDKFDIIRNIQEKINIKKEENLEDISTEDNIKIEINTSKVELEETELTSDESETDEKPVKKVYSESEIKKIREKKTELEAELKALEEQTKKAKELLAEYNELIGDDKVNTDDEAPDFKDE